MTMTQTEKEKDVAPLLQDNKRLAERLSKLKEENAEKEKKMKYCVMKKVPFGRNLLLQLVHLYLFN